MPKKKVKLTRDQIFRTFKYDNPKPELTVTEWEQLIRLINRAQYSQLPNILKGSFAYESNIWNQVGQLALDYYASARLQHATQKRLKHRA